MRKFYIVVPLVFLVFALSASADTLGQKATFNIDPDFDIRGDDKVAATLWAISNHAYFYVSDEYVQFMTTNQKLVLASRLENMGKEFENNIYPKLTGFWGEEPSPGVDNDPRITVLITELKDYAGGYFDTSNSFSKTQAKYSNERDMLYINSSALEDAERVYEFLSHELQHLISLNQKELTYEMNEDIWLNETRSEYSVSLAGYNNVFEGSNLQRRVKGFVGDPSLSLTEIQNNPSSYAQVAVFAEYLVDKYGDGILASSLGSSKVGIDSIRNFDEIFRNWTVANYLNDKGVSDFYGYDRPELVNFRLRPTKTTSLIEGTSVLIQTRVKDWQPNWYELKNIGNGIMRADFTGAAGEKFDLIYIAFWNDGDITTGSMKVENSPLEFYAQDLKKIVLIPLKKTRTAGFTRNEPDASYNIVARLVSSLPEGARVINKSSTLATISPDISDGSLIKLRGGNDIYVIRGEWKRYLLPGIIKMYGHLDPSRAIEVSADVFNSYKTSNYVRYVDDKKVYAVWPDGTKHWFNMTGEYFLQSGRSFDAIFIVNETEIGYYQTGSDITR